MADLSSQHASPYQASVSPYASSSHVSRGIGHGHRSLSRHSLRVTAPLLLVGVCAAVALAVHSGTPPSGSAAKASQTNVTVNHSAASQPSVTTPPATTDPSPSAASTVNAGNASNQSSVSTQVTVNGQPVDVPANGTVQNTTTNPDGSTTSYSVTTNTSGGSVNSSSLSTNVSVNSSSVSSGSSGTHGYTMVNGVPYFY